VACALSVAAAIFLILELDLPGNSGPVSAAQFGDALPDAETSRRDDKPLLDFA